MQKCLQIAWIPKVIVSNRDAKFKDKFWKENFKQIRTYLNMSSTYHPNIDGQTKIVNKCLEAYLHSCVTDKHDNWFQWLHLSNTTLLITPQPK